MSDCFITVHDNTKKKIADYFNFHSVLYEERPSPNYFSHWCKTVFYYSLDKADVTQDDIDEWIQTVRY